KITVEERFWVLAAFTPKSGMLMTRAPVVELGDNLKLFVAAVPSQRLPNGKAAVPTSRPPALSGVKVFPTANPPVPQVKSQVPRDVLVVPCPKQNVVDVGFWIRPKFAPEAFRTTCGKSCAFEKNCGAC